MEEKVQDLPTALQVEAELKKETRKKEYHQVLRTTVFALIVVTAAAVIAAVLIFPVLQIKGDAMAETLESGDVVVAMSFQEYHPGDIIAFYHNNTLLVKRVIAVSGDSVSLEEDGTVVVNGVKLSEPYLTRKALGECNIDFPCKVPDEELFVIGDNRETSIDSRNTALGTVEKDLVVGKLFFRVWPLKGLGTL